MGADSGRGSVTVVDGGGVVRGVVGEDMPAAGRGSVVSDVEAAVGSEGACDLAQPATKPVRAKARQQAENAAALTKSRMPGPLGRDESPSVSSVMLQGRALLRYANNGEFAPGCWTS